MKELSSPRADMFVIKEATQAQRTLDGIFQHQLGKICLGEKAILNSCKKNNLKNYKQNMLEKNLESVLGRVDLGLGIYH